MNIPGQILFFYESALRKLNTNFDPNARKSFIFTVVAAPGMNFFDCALDTLSIDSRDYMAYFYWGYVFHYDRRKYESAIPIWHKAIDADPDNPLIYHYLGRAYYNLGRYKEAEYMFKNAIRYYLDIESLMQYIEKDLSNNVYTTVCNRECITRNFTGWHYDNTDNKFLLGQLYENWNHYLEAENVYKDIITKDSLMQDQKNAFIVLTSLYEKLGQWKTAENFMTEFGDFIDYEFKAVELVDFYKRAADANPADGRWLYARGMMLRDLDADGKAYLGLDSIIFHPKLNSEYFIDISFLMDSFHIVSDVIRNIDPDNEVGSFLQNEVNRTDGSGTISATGRSVRYAVRTLTPRKDAIESLRGALPLFYDDVEKADIDFQIARLFVRSGSHRQAFPYFEEATAMRKEIASCRMGSIESGTAIYENTKVYAHLRKLASDTSLNHPMTLQLARFSLMAGDHTEALRLIDVTDEYYPFPLPEKYLYPALIASWSGKYDEAVDLYRSMPGFKATDPQVMYSLALLYARKGSIAQAKSMLAKAIDHGFNHVFVLHAEPLWKRVFGPGKWKEAIIVRSEPKQYESSHLLSAYYTKQK